MSAQPSTRMARSAGASRLGSRRPSGGTRAARARAAGARRWGRATRGRLDREVAALLAEPALADVEDLLALEQGPHDDRPFLECRDLEPADGSSSAAVTVSRILVVWKRRSCRTTSSPTAPRGSGRTRRRAGPRPASCSATTSRRRRGSLASAVTFPSSPTASPRVRLARAHLQLPRHGRLHGDFSIAGWQADIRAAVELPRGPATTPAGCGSRVWPRAARWPSRRRPPTRECGAASCSPRRSRCGTGAGTRPACSTSPAGWAWCATPGYPPSASAWSREVTAVDAARGRAADRAAAAARVGRDGRCLGVDRRSAPAAGRRRRGG